MLKVPSENFCWFCFASANLKLNCFTGDAITTPYLKILPRGELASVSKLLTAIGMLGSAAARLVGDIRITPASTSDLRSDL